MHGLDFCKKSVDLESALGQVDQVRAIVWPRAQRSRRGRQEAGMPAHHDTHVDAGQRRVVQVRAGKSLRHETRGAGEARRVVVQHQVVVDRLRHMHAGQPITRQMSLLRNDAHGVRRIVATDVEEVADAVRAQHLEDRLAVGGVGLVTGRAEGRRRCGGDGFQVGPCLLCQVDKVLIDDAAHAVPRAVHGEPARQALRAQHDADQRLVDDRSGPAALGDEDLSG